VVPLLQKNIQKKRKKSLKSFGCYFFFRIFVGETSTNESAANHFDKIQNHNICLRGPYTGRDNAQLPKPWS
jgi:hypothetical protein